MERCGRVRMVGVWEKSVCGSDEDGKGEGDALKRGSLDKDRSD